MKDKTEYINFMMWLQSDTAHLNYDPVKAAEKYIEFRGTPQPAEPLRTETIHSRYSPPEPEGAQETHIIIPRKSGMAYLQRLVVNASDNPLSESEKLIIELHNKLSNIKKVVEGLIDKESWMENQATNPGFQTLHRVFKSELTALLKTL